jgi:hypothetical protein
MTAIKNTILTLNNVKPLISEANYTAFKSAINDTYPSYDVEIINDDFIITTTENSYNSDVLADIVNLFFKICIGSIPTNITLDSNILTCSHDSTV